MIDTQTRMQIINKLISAYVTLEYYSGLEIPDHVKDAMVDIDKAIDMLITERGGRDE